MLSKNLKLKGIYLIKNQKFKDKRGFFFESFNKKKFQKLFLKKINVCQINHSVSKKYVIRGLHYQVGKFQQEKIVKVIRGKIFDVAVDLRKNSKTYGKFQSVILSDKNNYQLYIPRNFAHGFQVLSEEAEVSYITGNFYNPSSERTILWSDPLINIKWPYPRKAIISKKDLLGKNLA